AEITFQSSLCDEAARPLFVAPGAVGVREVGSGGVPKRPTGADCKSAGLCLRRFESFPHHSAEAAGPGPAGSCAGVAQLARASAFQAEGRGFESRLPL